MYIVRIGKFRHSDSLNREKKRSCSRFGCCLSCRALWRFDGEKVGVDVEVDCMVNTVLSPHISA